MLADSLLIGWWSVSWVAAVSKRVMILDDPATLVFVCALTACCFSTVSSSQPNYCESYLSCAHKLEQKQRECLELQERKSAARKNNCSNLSQNYRALELRKTEMYRDCVRHNLEHFQAVLSPLVEKTCDKLAKKFVTSTNKLTKRQQKRLSKKKKNLKKRELKECRTSAKVWHKHCRRLAKCCSVYDECSPQMSPIQKQINEEKRHFHEARAECLYKRSLKKGGDLNQRKLIE